MLSYKQFKEQYLLAKKAGIEISKEKLQEVLRKTTHREFKIIATEPDAVVIRIPIS